MAFKSLAILLMFAVVSIEAFVDWEMDEPKKLVANCVMNGKEVKGVIKLEEKKGKDAVLRISGEINGLKPGKHGFHVHEFGDLSKGCEEIGPHFNPYEEKHGGLNWGYGHKGDLGNIKADKSGWANIDITHKYMSLYGEELSIIGKSIVVHANKDDLGKGMKSKESFWNGNSGPPVGCCVIGYSYEEKEKEF